MASRGVVCEQLEYNDSGPNEMMFCDFISLSDLIASAQSMLLYVGLRPHIGVCLASVSYGCTGVYIGRSGVLGVGSVSQFWTHCVWTKHSRSKHVRLD